MTVTRSNLRYTRQTIKLHRGRSISCLTKTKLTMLSGPRSTQELGTE